MTKYIHNTINSNRSYKHQQKSSNEAKTETKFTMHMKKVEGYVELNILDKTPPGLPGLKPSSNSVLPVAWITRPATDLIQL